MKTTQEMFESLELQLSELIVLLKPKEIEDKDKELHEKLDAILQKQNEKPVMVFDDTKKEEVDEDFDNLSDKQFISRRNWFSVILALGTAGASWIAWLKWLSMFPMIFGFFVVAGGFIFALVLDHYGLPGNTIKRISKNAIGSAIIIFSFIVLYIGGVTIGNSLITNRERGEEYSAPTPTRTEQTVQQPAGTRQLDTTATDKEN